MVNEYDAECDGSDNQIFLWIDPLADCALAAIGSHAYKTHSNWRKNGMLRRAHP
jgi:hypothetical protein